MRFPAHISIAPLLALLLNVFAAGGGASSGADAQDVPPEGVQAQVFPPDSALVPEGVASPAYELPRALTPGELLDGIERSRTREGRIADYTSFLLMPGHYTLKPEIYIDPSCGNCEEPDTPVKATAGLVVSGVGIVIEGSPEDPGSVVLSTGAGYGIVFDDCVDCVLRGVTVTGGIRDEDQRATDAGVVVRNGSVRIENCVIRDNIGDSTTVSNTVVGIIGIAGREGASIEIVNNQIIRNSWDGIALYRGASAEITGNVIDGVDKAKGDVIGGGRGVGIGVTWDAKARIERNLVRRYWKGIGVFVDARCEVFENVVEEMLTWGIAFWDAGKGRPVARIRKNLIYDTGACGITIARVEAGAPSPGNCIGNMIVRTGLNPKYDDPMTYCGQCPISVEAIPEGFLVQDNIFYYNRRVECGSSFDDLQREEFERQAPPLLQELSSFPALSAARAFGELLPEDD
jgi:hypothetical protein